MQFARAKKFSATLLISGAALFSQGCRTWYHAARTTVLEPVEYCTGGNSIVERIRDNHAAEEELQSFETSHHQICTDDFGAGFKRGYVEYLFAGGTGEPPPVPPRCYWNAKYQTPEGREAIAEWFAGYRAGSGRARQSGRRDLIIVPSPYSIGQEAGYATVTFEQGPEPTLTAPTSAAGKK